MRTGSDTDPRGPAAAILAGLLLAAPLVIGDAVLRVAWLHAEAAALAALLAGLPLALIFWAATPAVRGAIGVGVAMITVVCLAGSAGMPAVWPLQAGLGLPVTVLAMSAGLRRLPRDALRMAAVNGMTAGAGLRRVLVPQLVPGLLGSSLIVFAAVLAGSLAGGVNWALPLAAMAVWMMWLLR